MHIKIKVLHKHNAVNDMTFNYTPMDRLTSAEGRYFFLLANMKYLPVEDRYWLPKESSSF